MESSLDILVQDWTRADGTDRVWDLYLRLQFLDAFVFGEYEPARSPEHPPFVSRLERWLATVQGDDDRRALFGALEHLYFISKVELEVLHVAAYEDIVLHWLIDRAGLTIGEHLADNLDREVGATWFCPITDSMEIARFCHLNGISGGHEYRPDWRSLGRFGDLHRIRDYLARTGTRHVVLLEDFVGTGNQASGALTFASEVCDGRADVLCCPLVISTDGLEALRAKVVGQPHVSVAAAAVLTDQCHVRPQPPVGGDPSPDLGRVRAALLAVHDQVACGDASLSPFGWGDLGTLAVLFTNCPNNVPPAIHHRSPSWSSPLFPRSLRSS